MGKFGIIKHANLKIWPCLSRFISFPLFTRNNIYCWKHRQFSFCVYFHDNMLQSAQYTHIKENISEHQHDSRLMHHDKRLNGTEELVKLTATSIWYTSVISIYITSWRVSRCWARCLGVAENPIGSFLDITTLTKQNKNITLEQGQQQSKVEREQGEEGNARLKRQVEE